jgi:signal recognition particle subunit SRP72
LIIEYWWCSQVSTGDLGTLWRQAADFHLRGGEPDVAAKSLEELLRLNPGDRKTLAQLVVAYAQVSIIFLRHIGVILTKF